MEAAAQLHAPEEADDGGSAGDGAPVEYGVQPAGRVRQILADPEDADQRGDDEALQADDEKQVATAAACVQVRNFVRGQVTLACDYLAVDYI